MKTKSVADCILYGGDVTPPLPVEMAFGRDDLEGRKTDCRVVPSALLAMTAVRCGDTVGRGFNPAAFEVVHPERRSRKAPSPAERGGGAPGGAG